MLRDILFLAPLLGVRRKIGAIDIYCWVKGKSLLDLAGLKIDLEEALGRKVNV